MSTAGPRRTAHTRVRVADFVVDLDVQWTPAARSAQVALDEHPSTEEAPDLKIQIVPRRQFQTANAAVLGPGSGFETVYGRFMTARWQLGDPIQVVMTPTSSLLRLARPLVDSEGHAIHQDAARMVTERIIPTYVQMLRGDQLSFVHGAAMADEAGDGLLISGLGGVGKTSLALELGLKDGWRFVSDDLVALDTGGTMHLNGSWPKIYGYNVQGDRDLEDRLMRGRSAVDQLHWRLRKPWPSRVRRAVAPSELYRSTVPSAPLRWMLLVERADVGSISIEPLEAPEAGRISAEILLDELSKARSDVESYLRSHECSGQNRFTWAPTIWESTITSGLARAEAFRVRVPEEMLAQPYRREMRSIVRSLAAEPATR